MLILFSYFWFEFMIKYSTLSSYDLSSSNMVYIETILKFPNYPWNPHGITQNPNIQKQDVLQNPELPWIYTDFLQDWVDEQWVNSFPYYNEQIVTKLNIVPHFVKQKIIRGIPLTHTNQLIEDYYGETRLLKREEDIVEYDHQNCKVLIDDLEYAFDKKLDSHVCIYGKTYLTFDFVEEHYDEVHFYFDKNVIFIKEIEKFI